MVGESHSAYIRLAAVTALIDFLTNSVANWTLLESPKIKLPPIGEFFEVHHTSPVLEYLALGIRCVLDAMLEHLLTDPIEDGLTRALPKLLDS